MICWRCHSNSVNIRSCLPISSDVKTRKRRNVVGIYMIQNNRIILMLDSIFQYLIPLFSQIFITVFFISFSLFSSIFHIISFIFSSIRLLFFSINYWLHFFFIDKLHVYFYNTNRFFLTHVHIVWYDIELDNWSRRWFLELEPKPTYSWHNIFKIYMAKIEKLCQDSCSELVQMFKKIWQTLMYNETCFYGLVSLFWFYGT